MRHTRTAVAMTTAAAVLGLTACGGSSEADSGGDTGGGTAELSLWTVQMEPTQKEAIEGLIDAFEDSNPDITVTVEERAVDAHKEALRQVVGTDAGPDIYRYWEGPGLGGELVDVGMSMDLTEYYDEYGWEDRFSEPVLAGITQYDGYHGVPFVQQAEALYYNTTLFEEAGITDLPETYEDLVAVADDLVAAGITPIEFGGTVNWHVMRLLDSLIETKCGVETADKLNTEQTGWDSEPCVTEAFTDLKTWADKYVNEGFMGLSADEGSQLFYTGDAAMALEGTWFNTNIVDNGMDPENIGIFPFPTGTGRLYGFGEAYYISSATENADAAAKFLDFMSSVDGQGILTGAFAAMSVNSDVPPAEGNPLHELWLPIFENATGLYINNDQNLSLEETTEYWRIQNSVLTGAIAPDDAGATLQAFIDANS